MPCQTILPEVWFLMSDMKPFPARNNTVLSGRFETDPPTRLESLYLIPLINHLLTDAKIPSSLCGPQDFLSFQQYQDFFFLHTTSFTASLGSL